MARSRRAKRVKSKPKLSWRILFLSFIPILALVFFIINQANGRNVLGISDTNFFNFKTASEGGHKTSPLNPSISPNPCRSLNIAKISFSTACGEKGFKQIEYTCADGRGAVVSKGCIKVEDAFNYVKKTCSKNSKCPKPSAMPTVRPSGTNTRTSGEHKNKLTPTPTSAFNFSL